MTTAEDRDDVAWVVERLSHNALLAECLLRFERLNLPNWYLGAGCVAQTVWNLAHERSAGADIKDYDLVYFDEDRSEPAEREAAAEAARLVGDLDVPLDVKNQARVHLWYPDRFGDTIAPYASAEDAIGTWPTTATAFGVRIENRRYRVCAPFGLDDLAGLVVRANRVQITPAIYESKVARWARIWPRLTVVPWSGGVGVPGARRTGGLGPEDRSAAD